MAADILAYRATHVPVGDDQKQHLELARDIAGKFNNDFRAQIEAAGHADGIFFPQPEPVITGPATRVMSLRDGTKKMSKSDPSDLSRINLTDDADTIAKKIQKAKTDPEPLPTDEAGPRAAAPRPTIWSASTRRCRASTQGGGARRSSAAARSRRSRRRCATCASTSSRRSAAKCAGWWPIRPKWTALLADGAERARTIAAPIYRETKQIVGFIGA